MLITKTAAEYNSEVIGLDDAVPANAFDLRFDDEGLLINYWIPVNPVTGSKELVHTDRGRARLEAIEAQPCFTTTSRGKSATGLLATDWALDDYNTWK